MARDPAEVLDRLIDSALDAALDDADYIENHQPGGADLLKALDAAGYEVRPKAEEGIDRLKKASTG